MTEDEGGDFPRLPPSNVDMYPNLDDSTGTICIVSRIVGQKWRASAVSHKHDQEPGTALQETNTASRMIISS